MEIEWKKVSLEEVAVLRNGAGVKQDFFRQHGVPLIRVSDFTKDSIDVSDCRYVDHEHARKWKSHLISKDDVIVATVGSWPPNWLSVVGKVVRAPIEAAGSIQNQNTCCILPKVELLDNRFLFYRLKLEDFIWHASNRAGGSANQARLPVKKLAEFIFSIPPLRKQKAIAHILGSLDNKIELNRQMNATLEGMAQSLFKSWFVDFDPVIDNALAAGNPIPEAFAARAETRRKALADGTANRDAAKPFPAAFQFTEEMGWIPEEWNVKFLSDFGKIVTGKTPSNAIEHAFGKSSIFLTPTDYDGNILTIETNRRLSRQGEEAIPNARIEKGSICVTCIGSQMGRTTLITEEAFTNQQINSIIPNSPIKKYYILINLRLRRNEIFAIGSSGSTMPIVNKGIFSKLPTLRPNDNALKMFNCYLSPIIDEIKKNSYQNQTLLKLRDTLLPKLMSGEIRIPEAEKLTEEALT